MAELEPIAPAEAKEMFLAQRRDEVAEATLQGYHYRLKPFVQWCEQESITNLYELTARSLHEYRLWRKEDGDLKTITLKGQLSSLRVFVKFLESIDGVEQGLHDKMLIPSVEDEEAVSNSILQAERAEQVLDYLEESLQGFSRYYEGIDGAALGFATFCKYDDVEMATGSYLVDEAEEMLDVDGEKLVKYVWREYGGDVQ